MRRLLNYNTHNETDSRLLTQYSAEYKIKNEHNNIITLINDSYVFGKFQVLFWCHWYMYKKI